MNKHIIILSILGITLILKCKSLALELRGDAIKGKSDIDIFVSIIDPNNRNTVKEYYEDLYSFLKEKMPTNMCYN